MKLVPALALAALLGLGAFQSQPASATPVAAAPAITAAAELPVSDVRWNDRRDRRGWRHNRGMHRNWGHHRGWRNHNRMMEPNARVRRPAKTQPGNN